MRRIWNKYDATIGLAIVALAVVGVIGGTLYVLNTYKAEEVGPVCTTDIVTLSPPFVPMPGAIDMLIELGLVPSVDAALESLVDVQYVFDPGEDHELEYWLYFQDGERITIAEFNIGCVLEDYTLLLEFEGVRGL